MDVAIFHSETTTYPDEPPFHPSVQYPETQHNGIDETAPNNYVYHAVRHTLAMLGLDSPNFGTPKWNPLGEYIRQGNKVVVKPNFVLHEFGALKGANCLTTHGSVIRAVIDYAYLAGGPDSSIVIADAPIQGAEFELLLRQTGIPAIQEYYWRKLRYEIKVFDLRQVCALVDESSSFIEKVQKLPGDPLGYREIDMGVDSRLSELDPFEPRYAVGDYDIAATGFRHNHNHHQYVVSNTILDADTIISVPKLKTHSKVGMTVSLKNVIGIIGSKDCLPHHRLGKTSHGGDEFPAHYPTKWYLSQKAYTRLQGRVSLRLWRLLRFGAAHLLGAGTPVNGNTLEKAKSFFPSGSWYGNDTIWRTVDDLNRIVFYYDDVTNQLAGDRQRRFFVLVDGIVAMEGNGPLRGTPKPCGVLLAGADALATDIVASTLMGFDWQRIRMLKGIAASPYLPKYSDFSGDHSKIRIKSNRKQWSSLSMLKQMHLGFRPPGGWRQYVEG
jgi:uncharacterized protein (DUF362 family)